MPLVAPWDESKYKRAPMGASGSTGGKTYRSLFFAAIAFWLLPAQATADEHPVLGQGNISCSSWLEV